AGIALAQDAPAANGGWESIKKRPADYMLDKNFMVNGGFDDPNYVSNGNPYWESYPVEVDEATEIPAWTLSTGGCWNGIVQIKTQTPDDYMIFEGNTQYLDMVNCTVNGWTKIKAQNTVTGLTPGKEYTLDMYVCHQFTNPTDWGNPDHGFNIYGKDPAGEGLGALMYANNELSEEAEWEYVKFTFTPIDDEVTIELWTCNYTGEGNESGVCWADFDEVRVYDADLVDPDAVDSIESIDNENAAVEYFTLQGVRMPAGAALHGTFIAKQGNKASKVYIR
ncbi:MAG: hypothetical protein K2N16_01445, partial [Muribaculaceae bacterium]|nr:hypothetical protein [Muribaculaceae bacterium]